MIIKIKFDSNKKKTLNKYKSFKICQNQRIIKISNKIYKIKWIIRTNQKIIQMPMNHNKFKNLARKINKIKFRLIKKIMKIIKIIVNLNI